MSARTLRFKQADIARAVKGAKSAGMDVRRVEIDREGKIVLSSVVEPRGPKDDLDGWLELHPDAHTH